MNKASGFTLLEMIVVLAIAALIIGVGATAMQQLTEDHELRQTAQTVEREFMQAMTQVLATAQVRSVALDAPGLTPAGTRLTIRHAGAEAFVATTGQRVVLRPGGLCEPLTLRWQKGDAWIQATLDPLTGMLNDLEESL